MSFQEKEEKGEEEVAAVAMAKSLTNIRNLVLFMNSHLFKDWSFCIDFFQGGMISFWTFSQRKLPVTSVQVKAVF